MTQTTVNKKQERLKQHRQSILCAMSAIHDFILNQCDEYNLNSSSYIPAYPLEFDSTQETIDYWERCIDALIQDVKDYYHQDDKLQLMHKVESLPIEDLLEPMT